MNGKYRCKEQYLYHEDIGEYKTYGVVWNDEIVVDDVSCDKEIAEEIVFMLNVYEVDTVHILEVIENLIAK